MDVAQLQAKIGVEPDGKWGPKSHDALIAHFTNTNAPAIDQAEIATIAKRLGGSVEQVNAVSVVESAGGGFDNEGKPKILFERHYFHRLTGGKWSPAIYSDPTSGGYNFSSWEKLSAACRRDPDAAFASASWGKFQVMGAHFDKLGYPSSYAMAWTAAQSEADHYEMLVRFIEFFGLKKAFQALSTNPDDCREFARRYNGSAYEKNNYHVKLAKAMR